MDHVHIWLLWIPTTPKHIEIENWMSLVRCPMDIPDWDQKICCPFSNINQFIYHPPASPMFQFPNLLPYIHSLDAYFSLIYIFCSEFSAKVWWRPKVVSPVWNVYLVNVTTLVISNFKLNFGLSASPASWFFRISNKLISCVIWKTEIICA